MVASTQEVVYTFLQTYYGRMKNDPTRMSNLYSTTAEVTHINYQHGFNYDDGKEVLPTIKLIGKENINGFFKRNIDKVSDIKLMINSCDFQNTGGVSRDDILIIVTGELFWSDSPTFKFAQTFVLNSISNNYKSFEITNDVLKFIPDSLEEYVIIPKKVRQEKPEEKKKKEEPLPVNEAATEPAKVEIEKKSEDKKSTEDVVKQPLAATSEKIEERDIPKSETKLETKEETSSDEIEKKKKITSTKVEDVTEIKEKEVPEVKEKTDKVASPAAQEHKEKPLKPNTEVKEEKEEEDNKLKKHHEKATKIKSDSPKSSTYKEKPGKVSKHEIISVSKEGPEITIIKKPEIMKPQTKEKEDEPNEKENENPEETNKETVPIPAPAPVKMTWASKLSVDSKENVKDHSVKVTPAAPDNRKPTPIVNRNVVEFTKEAAQYRTDNRNFEMGNRRDNTSGRGGKKKHGNINYETVNKDGFFPVFVRGTGSIKEDKLRINLEKEFGPIMKMSTGDNFAVVDFATQQNQNDALEKKVIKIDDTDVILERKTAKKVYNSNNGFSSHSRPSKKYTSNSNGGFNNPRRRE
ncbi:hypothetical protein NCAS_0A05680 [Naumovozyma castellii]|uniref:NTF2 domain-containing protein n=1 Tax=Naumovozyma castellii TaxID=27288 RepID=G0V6N0_NAUCA|nr:hypothetical protein NCAS_0A05680 [Naumovozyma castellii CBS 4309]CCC67126.1 hypothetical protein NCAS_0A05680 [Naumovozyma castellii CBS 4309]